MDTETKTYRTRFLESIKDTVHDEPNITANDTGGGTMVLNIDFPTVSPDVFLRFSFGPGIPDSVEDAKRNSTVSDYSLLWELAGPDGWPLEENGEGEHVIGYLNELLADVDTEDDFFEAEPFGAFIAATINKNLHPFGLPVETAAGKAEEVEAEKRS